MPIAVVSQESQRFELKSAPPDGYVELRSMTYGQKLQRQAAASTMTMRGQGKKDFEAEMQMVNQQTTIMGFRFCVVSHNLTDENEKPLDLTNPIIVQRLNPRVGEEIEGLIDKMNNFEDDEELGNS